MVEKVIVRAETSRVFPAAHLAGDGGAAPDVRQSPKKVEASLVCVGKLVTSGYRVGLKYTDGDGTAVTIRFDRRDGGLVCVERKGAARGIRPLCLCIEKGVRRTCLCRSAKRNGVVFEAVTYGVNLENDLAKTGRIHIEYTVDIHGMLAEKTTMSVTLERDASPSPIA